MITISKYALLTTSALAMFAGSGCSSTLIKPTKQVNKAGSTYRIQKASYHTSAEAPTAGTPREQYGPDKDSDTWDRVFKGFKLNGQVHNPRVQHFIHYYGRNPEQVTMLSERASIFMHMIVYELDRRNMPTELALLPFVESAFDPDVFSHVGAAGLWQFIPETGNDYGLTQANSYDARLDPFAATGAALDYLQKLHDDFNGDWLLALAAYNCGEGRVQREIDKNQAKGLRTDFWSLSLPKETREYVPRLLAFRELIGNASRYGIRLPETPNTARLAQLHIDKPFDLRQAAIQAGLNPNQLVNLNPCFRTGVTTPQYSNRIILPREHAQRLAQIIETLPPVASRNNMYASKAPKHYNKLATVRIGSSKVKQMKYARAKSRLRTAQRSTRKVDV
jgi:membrane-bound lytic murein transglycosylase D